MSIQSKVINVARSYVRTKPYGADNIFNGHNGQPWCAYFVRYIFKETDAKLFDWFSKCPNPAYVPAIYEWAKKSGRITYKPKKGDLVLYDWNANKSPDHIGFFWKKKGSCLVTVEGNTSNISQGNGGCVQIRYREPRWVLCFVRPPYKNKKKASKKAVLPTHTCAVGDTGKDVKTWQKYLSKQGYELKADGIYGALTRRAAKDYQKAHNLDETGNLDKKTLAYIRK